MVKPLFQEGSHVLFSMGIIDSSDYMGCLYILLLMCVRQICVHDAYAYSTIISLYVISYIVLFLNTYLKKGGHC